MKKLFSISALTLTVLIINLIIVTFWLVNSAYFPVHDFTSGARAFEFHQTLLSGQFPPRWSRNFGFGFGMPLFQFYAPLAFAVIEIFHLLGFSILVSLKLSYLLATLTGFIGSYLLAKKLTTSRGGLIAATAFTLAPYHAVNLYVRGALAEYWAISLMPLTFYFALKLLSSFTFKAYLGLTLALSALLLSHNVTVLTFMPFFLAFVIGVFILQPKIKNLIIVFFSLLHSIVIAAFFLIPAFLQKSFTRVESITQGYSQYQLHFLYFRQLFFPNWGYGGSVLGLNDDLSFYLSITIMALAAIGLGLVAYRLLIKKIFTASNFIALGLAVLLLFSLVLTNFKSAFIWQKISLLRFVQFPWRFLGVSSFLLSLLAAFAIRQKSIGRYFPYILALLFISNGFFFRPEKLIDSKPIYQPDPAYIQTYMSTILPDYLPPQVDVVSLSPPSAPLVAASDSTKIRVNIDNANQLQAQIQAQNQDMITINRFVFPNWRLTLNQNPGPCSATKNHLYQCQLPAGESTLNLLWQEKGLNSLSNILSLIGLSGLVFIGLAFSKLSAPISSKT